MTLVIERRSKKKLSTATRSAIAAAFPSKAYQPATHTAIPMATIACGNDRCPDPLSGKVEFRADAKDHYCLICGEYQNDLPDDVEEMPLHA